MISATATTTVSFHSSSTATSHTGPLFASLSTGTIDSTLVSAVETTASFSLLTARHANASVKHCHYQDKGDNEQDDNPLDLAETEEKEEVRVNDTPILHLQRSDIWLDEDDDLCSVSSVPHLNPTTVTNANGMLSCEEEELLPVGEAYPVLRCSKNRLSDMPLHEAHVVVDDKFRTEFISVTVVRKDNNKLDNSKSDLGIKFRRCKRKLEISYIDEEGLFANTDLLVGDEVMSIDDVSCKGIGPKSAEYVIQKNWNKSPFCNIMVRNEGGDASLVTNAVMKPSRNSLVGLDLKWRSGGIWVSSVESNGLFNHSLLDVGHRCLFINGISCANISLRHAAELVLNAKDQVTIVSRPKIGSAMVVSANPKRWWQIKGSRLIFGMRKTIPFPSTKGFLISS